MNYPLLFKSLLPECVVVLSLFCALGVDYGFLRQAPLQLRSRMAAAITGAGLLFGMTLAVAQIFWLAPVSLGQDQLMLTPLNLGIKAVLFGMAALVCAFSANEAPCSHVSEYYAMLLLSVLGAGFLVCTENILLLFVALELMSLSLYALTGFNKNLLGPAEAAFKYFTFGAVSSAFLLFGLSYFYGAVRTLGLHEAAVAIAVMPVLSPLLRISILLIIVGLGFKIAMAPFHFWVPDVYQKAPVSVAGWIASGSKIAGFYVLIKILQPFAQSAATQAVWAGALAFGTVVTLVIGNLGALRQNNLKRLLAYSSIAQAGYMLVGVLGNAANGFAAVIFYVGIYALANLGAFAVIGIVCDRSGREAELECLSGCWKRQPWLAVLLAVFFLSLAGIPPLAGFIGKFYLFFAAIDSHPVILSWHDGYYWLVGLALFFSAVSLYYYLRVLKTCFVSDPPEAGGSSRVHVVEWAGLILLAALILAGGLFPGPVLDFIRLGMLR